MNSQNYSICPSCNETVSAIEEFCDQCGYHIQVESSKTPTVEGFGEFLSRSKTPSLTSSQCTIETRSPSELTVPPTESLRRKNPVQVRVGLAIDRTESSDGFQIGVNQSVEILFRQLKKKASTIATWVQSHGDLDEGQDPILLCEDSNVETALAEVSGIQYSGGGFPPEHHLDALETLLNCAPWGGDSGLSRDAIVLLCTGPTKPTRSGTTPKELGKRFKDLGILLCVVGEPIDPSIYDLCEAADAEFEPINIEPNEALMQSVGSRLAASILSPLASSGTVPMN